MKERKQKGREEKGRQERGRRGRGSGGNDRDEEGRDGNVRLTVLMTSPMPIVLLRAILMTSLMHVDL